MNKKKITFLFILILIISTSPALARGRTVLMVVTGYGGELKPGHPTGYWAEELLVPYRIFADLGYAVSIATPLGRQPVADPATHRYAGKPYAWIVTSLIGHTTAHATQIRQFTGD